MCSSRSEQNLLMEEVQFLRHKSCQLFQGVGSTGGYLSRSRASLCSGEQKQAAHYRDQQSNIPDLGRNINTRSIHLRKDKLDLNQTEKKKTEQN